MENEKLHDVLLHIIFSLRGVEIIDSDSCKQLLDYVHEEFTKNKKEWDELKDRIKKLEDKGSPVGGTYKE